MRAITRTSFLQALGGASLTCAAKPRKGTWFPSEMREYRDPDTGREVWQMTNSAYWSGNLYFTAQSFTKDSREFVFMSARPDKTEMYAMEVATGRFRQVTEAETGAYHGCVCPKPNTVVYLDNGAVWWLSLDTLESRKIFTIPKDHRPDLLSIDDDGKYVAFAYCIPLEKPLGPDQTHHSTIVRIRTDGSGFEKVHEEDFWISHVIINPTAPETILFCHEGSWQVVRQRLWIVQANGSGLRKIRVEEDPEMAVGHELWTEHGAAVAYHGSYKGRHFLGRVRKDGSGQQEYTMTAPSGHTAVTEDGRLTMGDGSVEYPFLSLFRFKGSFAVAEPICNTGRIHRVGVHAHANFSADGRYAIFASERGGQSNVYIVRTEA